MVVWLTCVALPIVVVWFCLLASISVLSVLFCAVVLMPMGACFGSALCAYYLPPQQHNKQLSHCAPDARKLLQGVATRGHEAAEGAAQKGRARNQVLCLLLVVVYERDGLVQRLMVGTREILHCQGPVRQAAAIFEQPERLGCVPMLCMLYEPTMPCDRIGVWRLSNRQRN